MNEHYVYTLSDSATPDVPFYIGCGKGNRINHHVNLSKYGKHHNKLMQVKIIDILSNGRTVITTKLVQNCSREVGNKLEVIVISAFRMNGIELLNQTTGGDGVVKFERSDEWKQRASDIQKNILRTDERTKNASDRMTEFNRTHIDSEATRIKKSNSHKGMKLSQDTIDKIVAKTSKRVIRISDGKIYNSLTACAKDNNTDRGRIIKHCKNRITDSRYKQLFRYL